MSKPTSSAPSLEDTLSVPRKSAEEHNFENKSQDETDVEQGHNTEKSQEAATAEAVSPYHPSQFPDGGKDAWLCLLGSACCLFCSFGWLNCVGVFQQYYQTHQLSNYSPSTIAWISSLEIFMMFFPGPIVGFVYDNRGPKYLLAFGAFFHVFGIMMTSLCTEYWQFILAQGICSPLGLNCIFNAATSTVTTWFFKKRGAAYGLMAAGSGLGGVIFPIMTSHLVTEVGFGWSMRISAFLILFLLIVAFLTVKSRLPPRPRAFELRVFWEPFTDIRFLLVTFSGFLFFMGMFIPFNYIELQAAANGMSTHLLAYLVSMLNAASIFGRIFPGVLADKVGRFNMQVIMSFFSAILVLTFGLLASSNVAFILYAILYGFSSGGFIGLAPAQLAYISKVEQIGVRMGMMFAVVAFAGLIGNPVAGAISGFDGISIFAGVLLMAGAVMFTFTRMYLAKWKVVMVI